MYFIIKIYLQYLIKFILKFERTTNIIISTLLEIIQTHHKYTLSTITLCSHSQESQYCTRNCFALIRATKYFGIS